ncbi:MAG: efflux RND transporter periplasmic adaptor subunit [Lachnospiraceae bacterium]
MSEIWSKYKKWIIAAAAVIVIAAVFLFVRSRKTGSNTEDVAYVETVANLTGRNASLGMVNRFSGVVEPQATWSVAKNSEVEIEEIMVSEGDEVEEGEVLFVYSTDKYEEELQQAEIDLERLNNEYQSTEETIAQLEKEKKSASSSEQANYTIQIKEQNLTLKDKELDIQIKEAEIDKLESNIENAEVKSGISGIIKKINDEGSSSDGNEDNDFITVMKVGNYRVKGTVNEQNIGELYVDADVLVHSRVDDRTWKGKVTKIDTENPQSSSSGMYGYGGGDGSSRSSNYPFYVELDKSDGLIMGQHVYVEPDLGQENEDEAGSIWIGSFMVDQSDPDHPFVWKDVNGRLRKQEVAVGETREEIGKVRITEGLTIEDSICMPEEGLKEGMKTLPMSEKPAEETEDVYEEGMEEGYEGDMEGYEEGAGGSFEGSLEDGEGFGGSEGEGEGLGSSEGKGEGTGLETGGADAETGIGLESGD